MEWQNIFESVPSLEEAVRAVKAYEGLKTNPGEALNAFKATPLSNSTIRRGMHL